MFEGLLEKILQKQFGTYLEGLDENNLHIGVWAGNILLENVSMKKNALDHLGLPFLIKLGTIRLLQVKVPWRSLSSNPVEIVLEGLYILLVPKRKENWEKFDNISFEAKEKMLKSYATDIIDQLSIEDSKDKKGFWDKLMVKISDNIQLTIKDIHIRFEDNVFGKVPYSFGFLLDSLFIQTTNQNWQKEFIDRTKEKNKNKPVYRILQITSASFYWASNEQEIIGIMNDESRMEEEMVKQRFNMKSSKFILQPVSLTMKFTKLSECAMKTPKVTFDLSVKNFNVVFRKKQLDNIMDLVNVINQYQDFQYSYEATKHYGILRPIFPILGGLKPQILTDPRIRNENAVIYWKFAIDAIRRKYRLQKYRINEFILSESAKERYEKEFKLLFAKKNQDKEMNDVEKLRYKFIVRAIDIGLLKLWTSFVLHEIKKKNTEFKASKKAGGGIFGFFKKKKPQKISKSGLNEEDWGDLKQYLEENFKDEEEKAPSQYPPEYAWLSVHFQLDQASWILKNRKKGRDHNKGLVEGIISSLDNVSITFNKRDEGFDAEFYTGDIGVDIFHYFHKEKKKALKTNIISRIKANYPEEEEEEKKIPNQISTSNDIGENYFCKLLFSWKPPHSYMDSTIQLKTNPIKFFYQPLLLSRLIQFFGLGNQEIDEGLKTKAYDKVVDFKDTTQVSIVSMLSNQKNQIEIDIASPLILVPFQKNNDRNSPIWYIRLGDLHISSNQRDPSWYISNKQTIDSKYDMYHLKLSSITIIYYGSLILYEEERMKIRELTEEKEKFNLINDFTIEMGLKIFTGNKEDKTIPTVLIHSRISEFMIFFNPSMYKQFVNISECFKLNDDDEAWSQLMTEKIDIINCAKKIGIVRKRGDKIQKWTQYFCALSGGYLYFYDTNRQPYPSQYYYLKDCDVIDAQNILSEPFSIILRNRYGDCCLAFKDCNFKEWKTAISEQIYEISLANTKLISPKAIDYEDVFFEMNLDIPQVKINFLNEENNKWVFLQTKRFKGNLVTRAGDVTFSAKLNSLTLYHEENPYFKKLLYHPVEEVETPILDFKIEIQSKNSPKFKEEETFLKVQLGIGFVVVNFPPKITKRFIQYLYYFETEEIIRMREQAKNLERHSDLLENAQGIEDELIKLNTCTKQKDIFKKINAKIDKIHLICLHQTYYTPVCELQIHKAIIGYNAKIDHETITFQMGDACLYDMTNYPYTLIPPDYAKSRVKPFQMITATSKDDSFSLGFTYISHYAYCPLVKEKKTSTFSMRLGSLQVNFMNEFLINRFMEYLLEQFLDGISPKDYYQLKREQYEKNKKSHENMTIYDIYLNKEGTSSVEIVIENPTLILKPRSHYKDFFVFNFGRIKIWNSVEPRIGRWLHHPSETLLCSIYHIKSKVGLFFNDQESLSERFKLHVEYEMPYIEAEDYNAHDPKVLDQSYKIKISANHIKLSLQQMHYTYLLKCLDLNINYSDSLSHFFTFKQVQFLEIKDATKYKMMFDTPLASLFIKGETQNLLAELEIVGMNFDMTVFMNGSKQIGLRAYKLYGLEEDQSYFKKKVVISPLKERIELRTIGNFYDKLKEEGLKSKNKLKRNIIVDLDITPEYEKIWSIRIENEKIFAHFHLFLLLSNFFVEGLPNYETWPDKPYGYEDDPEGWPKTSALVSISNSISLLPSEDTRKVLAFEGKVTINYMYETLTKIKKQITESIEKDSRVLKLSAFHRSRAGFSHSPQEYAMPIYLIQLDLSDICPYMCNLNEFDGRSFEDVKKRQILEPFSFYLNSKEFMTLDTDGQFKCFTITEADVGDTKVTLSINDLLHISQAFSYNMKQLEQNYFETIIQKNKARQKQHQNQNHKISPFAQNPFSQKDEIEEAIPEYEIVGENPFLTTNGHQSNDEEENEPSQSSSSYYTNSENEKSEDSFDQLMVEEEKKELNDNEHMNYLSSINVEMELEENPAELGFDQHRPSEIGMILNRFSHNFQQLRKASMEVAQYKEKAKGYGSKIASKSTLNVTGELPGISEQVLMKTHNLNKSIDDTSENVVHRPTRFFTTSKYSLEQKRRGSIIDSRVKGYGNYERMDDSTSIVTHGLQIILINDCESVFYPLLNVNIADLQYEGVSKGEEMSGRCFLRLALFSYNPIASYWEPVIEETKMEFIFDKSLERQSSKLSAMDPININISDTLIHILMETYYSWQNIQNPQISSSAPNKLLMKKMSTHVLVRSSNLNPLDLLKSRTEGQGFPRKIVDDKPRPSMVYSSNEEAVCPYCIKNETGFTLEVKTQDDLMIVHDNENLNIQTNIAEASNSIFEKDMIQRNFYYSYEGDQNIKMTSKTYSIMFPPECKFRNIENLNLNIVGSFIFYLESKPREKIMEELKYVICTVNLQKMRKVLTIRTPYKIHNKTTIAYRFIFHQPNKEKQIVINPNDYFAVPFDCMDCKFGISNSLSKSDQVREMPALIYIIPMLNDKKIDEVEVGGTYTVLCKEESVDKYMFDVSLMSPFCIRNALPFNIRLVVDTIQQVYFIQKTKQESLNLVSAQRPLQGELRLEGFENSRFSILAKKEASEEKVVLRDLNGNYLKLYFRVILNKNANKYLVLYAKQCLINHTRNELKFYYSEGPGIRKAIAGQHGGDNEVLLLSKKKSIVVQLNNKAFSKKVNISAAGISNKFTIEEPVEAINGTVKNCYEFIYNTELSIPVPEEYIFTKIITVSPRFILANHLDLPILVIQNDCFPSYSFPDPLQPNDRRPFYWSDATKKKSISVRLVEGSNMSGSNWDWSCQFPIDELGTITIQNRNMFHKEKVFLFKINRKIHEGSIFVIIEKENLEHPIYRIENYSNSISLKYTQPKSYDADYLDVNCEVPFAWPIYNYEHMLIVDFLYGRLQDRPICIEKTRHKFNIDTLGQNYSIKLPLGNNHGHFIYISTFTDSYTKVIRFSDTPDQSQKPQEEETIKRSFHVNIKEIGLSIIMEHEGRRVELVYLGIENIQFLMADYLTSRKMQLQIGTMQIDNQLYYRAIYPVLFMQKMLKSHPKEKQARQSFFDIAINIKTDIEHVLYIEFIDCLIQTMEIKLDDEILAFLLKFVDTLLGEFNITVNKIHEIFLLHTELEEFRSMRTGSLALPIHTLTNVNINNSQLRKKSNQSQLSDMQMSFPKESDSMMRTYSVSHQPKLLKEERPARAGTSYYSINKSKRKRALQKTYTTVVQKGQTKRIVTNEIQTDWLEKDLSEKGGNLYIVNMKLSPIEINFSHFKKMNSKFEYIQNTNVLKQALGVALENIDNASLKLKAIEMSNVFGNINDVSEKIYIFYFDQLIQVALKIFGSLDIIGNPVNLFSTLSTGVKDFFFKPIEGFVQGPLEGSKGILEGTGSLFKNTIKGTFGSASKITSSFSKGLLKLSNDSDYINSREEMQISERPSNMVDGIGFGLKSAIRSLGSAMAGIVVQPTVGAQKKGVSGFFKGVFFGVTGAMVKPLSGGLDLLSKTSEGLKNTVLMFDEDKEEMRLRLPRRFYTKFDVFKEYDPQDASIMVFLENVNNGVYAEEHFIDCVIYNHENRYYLLLINEEHIVFINIGNKFVIWEIPTDHLGEVQKFSNGIQLNLIKSSKVTRRVCMEITDTMLLDEIAQKIQSIKK